MKLPLKVSIAAAALALGGTVLMCSAPITSAWGQVTTTAPDQAKTHQPAVPVAAQDADGAVARGRYIAQASDCVACHTAPKGGLPFAGGYALETPFGKLLASNITSDKQTGIGNWTEAEFERAVRHGKGKEGENLYPAMPYNAYVKLSDADVHDLWAYMQTVKPVDNRVVSNQLPFPFNIRLMMFGWNMLFFDDTPFKADPTETEEWNRGRYLVDSAGHCAACHTAKNFLGGDKSGVFLQGGPLSGWYAPEITGNKYVGIGSWTDAQVVQYLKTGANDISVATGPMGEAVANSTQYMTQPDLKAIAVYLKSLPGSSLTKPAVPASTAASADGTSAMALGARLYTNSCAACHAANGKGVNQMITSLADNPSIQSPDATTLIRTVLVGNHAAVTDSRPTGAGMPNFDWQLSDKQVASVLTYVRSSWGNAAPAVEADTVAMQRKSLGAKAQLTVPH